MLPGTFCRSGIAAALASVAAALLSSSALAAPADEPVANRQVRFSQGAWSALPQVGPDGRVRQCVLVALRQRAGSDSTVDTRLALNISRGSGLVVALMDDALPSEQVLDDPAQIDIDGLRSPQSASRSEPRSPFTLAMPRVRSQRSTRRSP